MSASPEVAEETRRWADKADNDIRNAEYVLTMREDCPFDTVAYHCQQCVEKYLKAILISREEAVPRTHDLVVLFNLATKAVSLDLDIQDVQPLNRYSIEARYPGDWEYIDEQEVKAALEMAKRARATIRDALGDMLIG